MSIQTTQTACIKDRAAAATGCRVLLVHGIWNARHWLAPFALHLRREGLAPGLFGYDSILRGAESGAERLVAHLRRKPTAWLVGHSLGGWSSSKPCAARPTSRWNGWSAWARR